MTVKHQPTDLAYDHCRKIASEHYENFPVGSILVPSNKRKYIYSVYAFARYADDIADSPTLQKSEKIRRLRLLEAELSKIEENNSKSFRENTKLIFEALEDTINAVGIPVQEFRDLLSAFRQDSEEMLYENFNQLIDYSSRSANPIGHIVLNVFGYHKEENIEMFQLSDEICTALQLTNFWQDVSEDLKMNRVYVPNDFMSKHKYSIDELNSKSENDNFRDMIKDLCQMTEKLFVHGSKLPELTKGRLKFELRATINGGRMILKKISEMDYRVLSKRPKLTTFDKFTIILKAFV